MIQLPVTKVCTNCKKRKRASAFYRNGTTLRSRCIECHKKISLAYKALNPEHRKAMNRNANLTRMYGITSAEYDAMFAKQNGVCAACGEPERECEWSTGVVKRLAVDHNHATGRVRGLLCRRCNTTAGHYDDDPQLLARLVKYLRRHARN